MQHDHTQVLHTWNVGYIALSYVIATLTSFVSLQLAGRAERNKDVGSSQFWLIAQAIILGYGIWAMHFVGMLAFQVSQPSGFQVPLTILSGLAAVALIYPALHLLHSGNLTLGRLSLSGLIAGSGIVVMHYLGMAAYQVPGTQAELIWLPLAASVLIAVGASMVALYLFKLLASPWAANQGKLMLNGLKVAAALIMGVAITGMHYTGMAAIKYVVDPNAAHAHAGILSTGTNHSVLALVIGVISFLLIGLAVTSIYMDTSDELAEFGPAAAD